MLRWSTPPVTSSSSSTRGSVASARASSRRLRWPVESVPRVREGLVAEPDPLEQRVGPRARVPHVAGAREGAHHDVVDHAHPRERPELLERARDAQPAHAVRGEAGEPLAVQAHLARVGMIEAADDLEQRGLARPVRPDDAHQLARRDLEGDLAVGDDAAESLGDAAERRAGSCRARRGAPPPAPEPREEALRARSA